MTFPTSRNKAFRALFCVLLTFLTISATSCSDEDDPYYSPLVGDWALVDYAGPGNFYIDGLSLYSDGTGYVSGYNDYGVPDSWFVMWSSFNNSTLMITFTDGYGDTWSYYYDFNNGELHLQPVDDPMTDYWFVRA